MTEQILRLRDTNLEWRAVEGEVVALDMTKSAYLAVNDSGRRLWEELARGTTRNALVELLVSSYGLDRDRAETDTAAFLSELEQRGLLASP
ncbi:MAG: PqqD family protein [Solirubrobacteraceae bacterium]|jgi:hypothetical protein